MTTAEHIPEQTCRADDTPDQHRPIDFIALGIFYRPDPEPESPFDPWEERLTLEQYVIDAIARGIPADEITDLANPVQGPLTAAQIARIDQTGRKQVPQQLGQIATSP